MKSVTGNQKKINATKIYKRPKLKMIGFIAGLTHAHQGGPNFDGGSNPEHKVGPVS